MARQGGIHINSYRAWDLRDTTPETNTPVPA
jgi:hypothetical protein